MLLRISVLFVIANIWILEVHSDLRIEIYKPNEFKLSLPDDKTIVKINIEALHPKGGVLPTKSHIITTNNIIKVSGNQFNLVKDSDINYTIGYEDAKGYHDIQGTYIFDGDYETKNGTRQKRYADEKNISDEKITKEEREEKPVKEKEPDDKQVDISSRFGGGFGKTHNFYHRRRFGPPPFLPNHQFGRRPYYPPPYHPGRDYGLQRWDHGHGPRRWHHHHHKNDGPCSHHSNEFDDVENDYNFKDYKSKPVTTSTLDATTKYKPEIDIRIAND